MTDYLTQLAQRLRQAGLPPDQVEPIIADVGQRLASLLYHWPDTAFRRTLLALGLEEATHYRPRPADIEICSLAVVAIRNSLLAELFQDTGRFKQVLSGADLTRLLEAAVRHFTRHLDDERAAAPQPPQPDLFGPLPRLYPAAWQTLGRLADLPASRSGAELRFEMVEAARPPALLAFKQATGPLAVRESLGQNLSRLKPGDLFYQDSLVWLSREPQHQCAILELVLDRGAMLVLPNFCLGPGYVARRARLLDPARTALEAELRLRAVKLHQTGLTEQHRAYLDQVRRSLLGM